jgi:hypothetical protein
MKGIEGSGCSLFQHTNLALTRSELGTSYVEVGLDKLQHGSILSQPVVWGGKEGCIIQSAVNLHVRHLHTHLFILTAWKHMCTRARMCQHTHTHTHTHTLTYLLTYGAANCAAPQEHPSISWNPKVQYRVHKSPPLVPILSHINPIHSIPSSLSKIHFNTHTRTNSSSIYNHVSHYTA